MRFGLLMSCLLPVSAFAQTAPVDEARSEAAFREAQAAYRGKRYAESERAFREALEHWPDNPGALNDLAWLYVSASDEAWIRPESALPFAERAVEIEPQNDAYLDTLATAYHLLGRHLKAARIEARALALAPKRAEYGGALARFASNGLEEQHPDPIYAELWRLAARGRLVLASTQKGDARAASLAAALDEARGALTLDPVDLDARALEARALAALGQHDPAVQAFRIALEGRRDVDLERRLGASLTQLGRHAEAATVLEALLAEQPADHDGWERLVDARQAAGAHAQASGAVEKAVGALARHAPLWPTRRIHRLRLKQARAHDALAAAASDGAAGRAERRAALRARVRAAAVRTTDDALDAVVAKAAVELDPALSEAALPDLRRALAVEALGPEQDVRFVEAPLPAFARGTRVALADVDGDGDPDLLLSGRRLLLNDGRGRFVRAPGDAGLGGVRAVGGVFADYDRDGDLDLYAISHTKRGDRLLRNDSGPGDKLAVRFTDVTDEVGGPTDDLRSEGAAWGDLNGDGYPDLYVANYEKAGKAIGRGTHDRLWLSDGKGGFVDASKQVRRGPYCGRGVAMADVDQDGDLDVFVSNYRLNPDLLWLNDGEGGLQELAVRRGVAGWQVGSSWGHTIGSAWGDLDDDGDLDLVAAKLAHPRFAQFSDPTRIFLQEPDGRFVSAPDRAGVTFEETHSDPTLLDVDDDGDLDLFLTSVYAGRPSFLWRNQAGKRLRFVDVTWAAGVRVYNGWGAAAADVDQDGDQDLVVAAGGRARLFLNQREGTQSVRLRLRGTRSDTWGAGATVILRDGEWRRVRQLSLGHGTTSQSEPILHFGVGTREGPFAVEVRWPSGRVSTHEVGPGRHELREP